MILIGLSFAKYIQPSYIVSHYSYIRQSKDIGMNVRKLPHNVKSIGVPLNVIIMQQIALYIAHVVIKPLPILQEINATWEKTNSTWGGMNCKLPTLELTCMPLAC